MTACADAIAKPIAKPPRMLTARKQETGVRNRGTGDGGCCSPLKHRTLRWSCLIVCCG
jgi:hypothetical protein